MKKISIVGYFDGNQIGVIDASGKFNTSDKLDFNSRMFFDSENEANEYIENLNETENNREGFKYQIDIFNTDDYE